MMSWALGKHQVHRYCQGSAPLNRGSLSSFTSRFDWRRRVDIFRLRAAKARVPSTEAAVLLESGFSYLDVRTPEEFAEGHVPGAVNIPFFFRGPAGFVPNPEFIAQVQQQFPDADEHIVVGCRSGSRSAQACALLEGYSSLVDDAGGWLGWIDARLPVVRI